MWPFTRKQPAPASPSSRAADGSILADLIAKGLFDAKAGTEPIGYFNPSCAPFRTFPGGKSGLTAGPMADMVLGGLQDPAVARLVGDVGAGDLAIQLGRRLGAGSCQAVLAAFQPIATEDAVGSFLIVTTTMPFLLKHCTGQLLVIDEVEHELRLNALAQLLLHDPAFAGVTSPPSFRAVAAGLTESRKDEFERMRILTAQQIQARP